MNEQIFLSLYSTLSLKKEKVVSRNKQNILTLYTCGPTVYDYAHIGNFRTYVAEDLLRRVLQLFEFKIVQVMNITDVDDKTIKGAIEANLSLEEYTKPFKDAFFTNLQDLSIEKAEHYPQATQYIEQMIQMILSLLEKGVAYKKEDGSVYFSIKSFPAYGRLSHLHLDELQVGASQRVHADEYDKDNASDFVLWKAYDPKRDGEIFWKSPFGKGRPGWHIECSSMAIELLGNTVDIHCGGVDNIFPHHENEIAQSESFFSNDKEPFVRYWMHVQHLIVDNRKMSKSLGNFYTLNDLLKKGYTGRELRYLLLHTHYRSSLNFTLEGLDAAKASLERVADFIRRIKDIKEEKSPNLVQNILDKVQTNFKLSLADDMNISSALAALFDMIREIHVLCDNNSVGVSGALATLKLLAYFDTVLAVLPLEAKTLDKTPKEVALLLENRNIARKEKKWALADELRDQIHSLGYVIEDTPQGAKVKKTSKLREQSFDS